MHTPFVTQSSGDGTSDRTVRADSLGRRSRSLSTSLSETSSVLRLTRFARPQLVLRVSMEQAGKVASSRHPSLGSTRPPCHPARSVHQTIIGFDRESYRLAAVPSISPSGKPNRGPNSRSHNSRHNLTCCVATWQLSAACSGFYLLGCETSCRERTAKRTQRSLTY